MFQKKISIIKFLKIEALLRKSKRYRRIMQGTCTKKNKNAAPEDWDLANRHFLALGKVRVWLGSVSAKVQHTMYRTINIQRSQPFSFVFTSSSSRTAMQAQRIGKLQRSRAS